MTDTPTMLFNDLCALEGLVLESVLETFDPFEDRRIFIVDFREGASGKKGRATFGARDFEFGRANVRQELAMWAALLAPRKARPAARRYVVFPGSRAGGGAMGRLVAGHEVQLRLPVRSQAEIGNEGEAGS